MGKKCSCGTDKAKVFCALSLNADSKPLFLKLKTTKDMCQKSVAEFAKSAIKQGAAIHTDGYRSYKKGLDGYEHQPKIYNLNTGLLHWLHIMISNAKAFILGTFHGLPKKNLDFHLSEFYFRAIPHNSKCRYSERGAATAKPKAQIIWDVLSSILATQMPCRSRRSGA